MMFEFFILSTSSISTYREKLWGVKESLNAKCKECPASLYYLAFLEIGIRIPP